MLVNGVNAHKACRPPTPCSRPDCSEPAKARGICSTHYNQEHYALDPERHRARARQYSFDRHPRRKPKKTPEERAATHRTWYQNNRLKMIAIAANAKARRLGIPGVLTGEAIAARFAYFGHRCWICGEPDATTVDHVKPFGRGGLNVPANIRPAHLGCNAARSWEGRR